MSVAYNVCLAKTLLHVFFYSRSWRIRLYLWCAKEKKERWENSTLTIKASPLLWPNHVQSHFLDNANDLINTDNHEWEVLSFFRDRPDGNESNEKGVVNISIMKPIKRINCAKTINGIFPSLSIVLLYHSPGTGIHHFLLFLFIVL